MNIVDHASNQNPIKPINPDFDTSAQSCTCILYVYPCMSLHIYIYTLHVYVCAYPLPSWMEPVPYHTSLLPAFPRIAPGSQGTPVVYIT